MALTAREQGNSKFEPVEQGLHHAICFGVYDLGTHFQPAFDKSARKVLIMWELPEERIDLERDGEQVNLPRAVSKQYTLSLNEKSNLRRDLQSWRNKVFSQEELAGFDVGKLLGVNCMIQILHSEKNGKVYANVASVTPLPKGFEKHPPENEVKFFSFDDDMDIPNGTPKFVVEIIKESEEWPERNASAGESEAPPLDENDIPF